MAEVSWIRITTTMFDDEKVKIIEAMPEGDTILIIWIKLLALCGRCNSDGYIMLTDDIPYTEEMLATIMARPLPSVQLALKTFEQFGMIGRDEVGIFVANWEKHQNIEGLERIKEQARIRKQRQRDREKQCHVTVTGQSQPSHATDKEEDKDKENNKKSTPPKTKYADYVTLTEDEHAKLVDKLGEKGTARAIEILDNYKGSKNRKYASDYRAILSWVVDKLQERQPRGDPKPYTHQRTDQTDLMRVIERKTINFEHQHSDADLREAVRRITVNLEDEEGNP